MVKLVDTPDSKSGASRRTGSIPVRGTTHPTKRNSALSMRAFARSFGAESRATLPCHNATMTTGTGGTKTPASESLVTGYGKTLYESTVLCATTNLGFVPHHGGKDSKSPVNVPINTPTSYTFPDIIDIILMGFTSEEGLSFVSSIHDMVLNVTKEIPVACILVTQKCGTEWHDPVARSLFHKQLPTTLNFTPLRGEILSGHLRRTLKKPS